tara:strand:+ start:406 stop:645 length:240 start_codon:yes stop_codon:yes gene_type:complete
MTDFIERNVLELLKRSEQQSKEMLVIEQVAKEESRVVEVVTPSLNDFSTAQAYIDNYNITDAEIIARVTELKDAAVTLH